MNELRRCLPEIERELHDKEARIRELEGALERLIDAAHPHMAAQDHAPDSRCGLTQPITVAEGEELNNAVTNARATITRLHAPPDSESNQCDGCRRGLHVHEGMHYRAYDDRPYMFCTADRYDSEPAEGYSTMDYGGVGQEPAEGEKHSSRDFEGTDPRGMGPLPGEPGNPNPSFEQMDAMLEQEAMEALDDIVAAAVADKGYAVDRQEYIVRQALSRTSDAGTGCVVPEAVRRLPDRMREHAKGLEGTEAYMVCLWERYWAGELDHAIAEQGGQSRIPVGLARLVSEWLADFPEGGDLDGFDQQAMMERAGIIEAMEITEIPCGDSCSCDEYGADVGDTCYRVTALGDKCRRIAAASQPEHGESDE